MKIFLSAYLVMLLIACNSSSDGTMAAKTKIDTGLENYITQIYSDSANAITDSILTISFVQVANAYIDSISDHKHGISFIADTVSASEIHLKAGYNNDSRFETYFQFYYNPKTLEMKVYDPETDTRMSVVEYHLINN